MPRRHPLPLLTGVALVLCALAARPASGLGLDICAPGSAGQAYDELLAAAPDGSDVEAQANDIAADARGEGTFDSDETIARLDELARSADYTWDCRDHVYRYSPPADDPSGEDEAAVIDPGAAEVGAAEPDPDDRDAPTAPDQRPDPNTVTAAGDPVAVAGPRDAGVPGSGPSESRTPIPDVHAVAVVAPDRSSPGPTATRPPPPTALAVSAAPGRSDHGGGPLRWIVGGASLAALAVMLRRRRR